MAKSIPPIDDHEPQSTAMNLISIRNGVSNSWSRSKNGPEYQKIRKCYLYQEQRRVRLVKGSTVVLDSRSPRHHPERVRLTCQYSTQHQLWLISSGTDNSTSQLQQLQERARILQALPLPSVHHHLEMKIYTVKYLLDIDWEGDTRQ